MPVVELDAGRIHYTVTGPPDGRPVVFVHGFLADGRLFDDLARRLAADGLRCLLPTWPLGAHVEPLRPAADRSPLGIAGAIAGFLDALDLRDVVLVGNDSGGALCQLVAVHHPERLGALVLTNCDAFDNFPPSFFKALVPLARVPALLRGVLWPLRWAAARRSPLAFGLLAHQDVDHLAREWVRPALEQRAVFEDARRFVAAVDPAATQDAAARLRAFDRPALLAWGVDDRLFPIAHAHRLAAILPDARVEAITESRTFPMIDQPERLAALVSSFARNAVAAAA